MAGLINFEDENEVKQFLDNLGVEYSYQCYKEKDPEGNSLRCSESSGAETHNIKMHVISMLASPFYPSYVFLRMPKAG